MIGHPSGCDAFLRDLMPNGWQDAAAHARRLAARLQYLPWGDRMAQLDDFVWSEARRLLSNEEITAVINRQPYTLATGHAILEYATMCGAVITSILVLIGEGSSARQPEEALALLLSRHAAHQETALGWIQTGGFERLRTVLARLPGFAFLILAVYPNDSAESFMARDAFWTAMLGY